MKRNPERRFPQGIEPQSLDPGIGGWWGLIRLALIGGVLAVAAAGLLGSGNPEPRSGETGAARLTVEMPVPLRNGMFFETRITARPKRAVGDAVIAVPAEVWRDITINTMIPAAGEEEYKDGYFLFRFGPLEAGETLLFKLDGQINPSRQADLDGLVEFRDDDAPLARAPIRMKVIG